METEEKIKNLMTKIKKLENGENLDLSSGKDLVVAVMNLISIEENLFFTGIKLINQNIFSCPVDYNTSL